MPSHNEAVARLVHAIEGAERSAVLLAGSGMGKSTVLARTLEAVRSPHRRVARVSNPADGTDLFATLAVGLGARVAPDASRSTAWRALVEAAKLCRWQRLHVVLAVDAVERLAGDADRFDRERLDHIDNDPAARLTVLRVGRSPVDREFSEPVDHWRVAVRLAPLTRSEASLYVAAKLEAAGRPDPTFTPRALTRLHVLANGLPRGLDRLAALAMMAGAVQGLDIVSPEVVEQVFRECEADEMTLSLA